MSDIQSVRRAFTILKAVSANEADGATLSEIAASVELPKSTVSRMLTTLEHVGAVERLAARDGFRIGDGVLALASSLSSYPRSLSALARPYLQQLAQATGETLTLCVPDGECAHYIDQINPGRALQVHDWTGQRIPLHACSDGKLFLAHRTDAEVERYLSRPLERFTAHTVTSASALRRELRAIRKAGCAWTHGEYDAEIVGVAAPVRDTSGAVIGSVCLFGPAYRWPEEGDAATLVELAKATAARISARLAGSATPKEAA
jgi:DNA-binding IclR family transcriptional regulator